MKNIDNFNDDGIITKQTDFTDTSLNDRLDDLEPFSIDEWDMIDEEYEASELEWLLDNEHI